MRKGLFIAILAAFLAPTWVYASGDLEFWTKRCEDLIRHANKYRGAKAVAIDLNPDLKFTWYMTVDFGNANKAVYEEEGTDVREIDHVIPVDGSPTFRRSNLFLDPQANPGSRYYTAEARYGAGTDGKDHYMLYNPGDERVVAKINSHLELTWQTYLRAGTVTEKEILDFKATESALDPIRKITFVGQNPQGQTVSVLRLYDGSAYPMYYMGIRVAPATPNPAPAGNYHLPLERRYPHINFRETTHHIFEPGRQSIDGSAPGEFKHQLRAMASYFMQKYGARPDVVPGELLKEGRVYVEITSKHLRTYLSDKANGGLGFKLFARVDESGEMNRVQEGLKYSDLKVDRKSTDQKFILYRNIEDFVFSEMSTYEH